MITVKPLKVISLEDIYNAWQDAFSEYFYKWSKQDIEKMMLRRGYDADLSFGAFDGDTLVSFTLNCVGTFNGVPSVYDTGSGTIKAYRKQGLATRVFDESIPALNRAGIKQYLLDVLQTNTDAISVYKNTGFEITRGLIAYRQNVSEVKLNDKTLPEGYTIEPLKLTEAATVSAMWDFLPAWQNSVEALLRVPQDFKIVGAYTTNGMLAGYGVIAPESGDITQLAVAKEHRRKGVGSGILKELLKYNTYAYIKLVHIEDTCASAIAFIESNGFPKLVSLLEMNKTIEPA